MRKNLLLAVLGVLFMVCLNGSNTAHALGPSPVDIGSAADFVVLTKTGLANTGPSVYSGNIGASPITGAAITGLACAEVEFPGTVYTTNGAGPAAPCNTTDAPRLTTAVADMTAAKNNANGRAADYTAVGGGVIGNTTFAPGVYKWTTAVSVPADMTISGGEDDVWIFQVDGAFALGTGFRMNLAGGAQSKNIFWQIDGAITFAANSHFSGVLLAEVGITAAAGVTMDGRILTQTAVTATALSIAVYPVVPYVPPDTTRQLNFTGRLLNAAGGIVPDGNYNIQFKIYQDGDGTSVGNSTGTTPGVLKWTETFFNSNNEGVTAVNGFISVRLGSVSGFGDLIDWNQATLFLSMNVGNTNTTCSVFISCGADGEMLPMKQLASTPFALNSNRLGGLASSAFIQMARGVQTDTSSDTSSIYINKSGTGNLITLQSSSADAVTITNKGDIKFGANADHSITVASSPSSLDGKALTISAGSTANPNGTGAAGGMLTLQGGDAGGMTGTSDGGKIVLRGGAGAGTGVRGLINIGASAYTAATDTVCAANCTITKANIDNYSTVILNASASGTTMTLPAPTNISTAGRILYLTAASGSSDFAISANTAGNIISLSMRQNLTATLVWNGTAWTSGGATNATTLQNAYANAAGPSVITLTDNKGFNITSSDTVTDSNIIVNLQCTVSCGTNGRFAVQNSGIDVITVSPNSGGITLAARTQIGSSATDGTQINFQLDSANTASDAGACSDTVNQGVMYYNSLIGSIRACTNGAWGDLSNPDTLGLLSFGVLPSSGLSTSAYDLPSLVTTGVSGPCKVSWGTVTSVNINACVAYSGGKRVQVAATTLSTNTASGNNTSLTAGLPWGHICLTGANGQPAFTTINGVATPNAAASLPVFSVSAPILCLADVFGSPVTPGNIANIYDVRTFTSTLKEAVTASTGIELGTLVDAAGTGGAMTPATAGTSRLYGLVVATNGTTSGTTPNAIVTTSGPGWIKATSGTGGQIVTVGASAGYANTVGVIPVNSAYYSAGVTRTSFANTCTTVSNCNGSLYVNFSVR
jgi:hypothetical protein